MTTTQPEHSATRPPASSPRAADGPSRARAWRLFRSSRSGMAGLVILLLFILVAVFAPVLADPEGLEVTKATGGVLEPPSSEFWLGTDDNGRSVLTQLIWGARISLFVGLMATLISMLIGTVRRPGLRLLRRLGGREPVPGHRVVPGHPVPAARDRAGHGPRPVPVQHRAGDRRDVLGQHGAADPQPDAVHQGTGLPRALARARCRSRAPDRAGTCCPT